MRATGNSQNNQLNPKNRNYVTSFTVHAERMKMFRKSHSRLKVKSPRPRRPVFFDSLRSLTIIFITKETGGTRELIESKDWSTLIPLPEVALLGCLEN